MRRIRRRRGRPGNRQGEAALEQWERDRHGHSSDSITVQTGLRRPQTPEATDAPAPSPRLSARQLPSHRRPRLRPHDQRVKRWRARQKHLTRHHASTRKSSGTGSRSTLLPPRPPRAVRSAALQPEPDRTSAEARSPASVPGLILIGSGELLMFPPSSFEEASPGLHQRAPPQQRPPLALSRSTPDSVFDVVVKSVSKAFGTYRAAGAQCFSLLLRRAFHKETVRICGPAGRSHAPRFSILPIHPDAVLSPVQLPTRPWTGSVRTRQGKSAGYGTTPCHTSRAITGRPTTTRHVGKARPRHTQHGLVATRPRGTPTRSRRRSGSAQRGEADDGTHSKGGFESGTTSVLATPTRRAIVGPVLQDTARTHDVSPSGKV